MSIVLPDTDLRALESRVQYALKTGDDSELDVLGYGEVTLVLRLETADGVYAAKRLPVFPTRERFLKYRGLLADYLDRLGVVGLSVAETELWEMPLSSGRVVAYAVQEALPSSRLCSRLLHSEGDAWAAGFFKRFLDHIDRVVTDDLGLDAQASNWIEVDGALIYLDVTTPLMRDVRGAERLDVKLFFTSLPVGLRDVVRVTMSKSIFDKFYLTRGVVLDFLGNLYKEGLHHLVPAFLDQANARLSAPIGVDEVAAYYRGDARMWELIQRLRKADRFVHRAVLRRPYPFLLPPDVAR